MENADLKYIKKYYGERFARFCRENFPTLLETEGLLSKLMETYFAHTHSLYDDVCASENTYNAFIAFINALVKRDKRIEGKQDEDAKTAKELMDEAGYILFPECKTESDIEKFKKYYDPREELCTFRGGRLKKCRVWFAVKKNVDEIKREDFRYPERQDDYGTSVISIQFTKSFFTILSIKNRYNHTVDKPDSTFENNLDNIIPGLAWAFEREYGLSEKSFKEEPSDIMSSFFWEKYQPDENLKYYRVNCEDEEGNIYCENNIILDSSNCAIQLDKSQYLLMDEYIVDLKNKTIFCFSKDTIIKRNDSFIKSLGKIVDIKLSKDEEGNKVVVVVPKVGENILITLNSSNAIIGLVNNNVVKVGEKFLQNNKSIKKLEMKRLKRCRRGFLRDNQELTQLDLPCLESAGSMFLMYNRKIKNINLSNLKLCGDFFLYSNDSLLELQLDKLERAGNNFLMFNTCLEKLSLKNMKSCGNSFLYHNMALREFCAEKLELVGNTFLYRNNTLTELKMPCLKSVECFFMTNNKSITSINFPKLKYGENFLNSHLKKLLRFNSSYEKSS